MDKMQSYLHLSIQTLNICKSVCEKKKKEKDNRKCVICPWCKVQEKNIYIVDEMESNKDHYKDKIHFH